MMNQSFNYIEDYIEYIGGYNPAHKSKSVLISLGMRGTSPLSLARYDVSIVDSLCTQILYKQIGLTDKQAELAKTLIAKYRKQLEKQGINIPETLDKFRLPIRKINNTMSVEIDRNKSSFVLRFPYNTDLIAKLRNLKTTEDLSATFDFERKVWLMPLTEFSLNYIKVICNETHFTYDPEILELYDRILEIEKQDHSIELREVDGELIISNAASSLLEYINRTIGEIAHHNFFKLIDLSSTLGYTVSIPLINRFTSLYDDPLIQKLALKKITKIKLVDFDFEKIIEYMKLSGRNPAHTYVTSYKNLSRYKHDDIEHLNKVWPDSNVPIKLFISQTPILMGVRKSTMLKMAEKLIIVENETM